MQFLLNSIAICSLSEVAGEGISSTIVKQIVPDNTLKSGKPRLNGVQEISLQIVIDGISTVFFATTSNRK